MDAAALRRQRGGVLLALMAGLVIATILSGVAFQVWADVLRRDKEAEMMFRAQEICRALKKYRRDRGQLPGKLEQLIEPGSRGQYFLRHLYKDPLVKGGKWGLLYMGPTGAVVDPNAPAANENQLPGLGGGPAEATDPQGADASPVAAPPSTPSAAGGTEMTGLPIAGVKSLCKDKPFRKYRDHEEYSEWLFTIFDLEPAQGAQPGQPGQPGQVGQPPPSPSPRGKLPGDLKR